MKILLAMEHYQHDSKSTQFAKQYLENMDDVEIIVLYVSNESASVYYNTAVGLQQILTDDEWAYRSRLETDVAREFRPWSAKVKFRHELGHPANVICSVAAGMDADLIILGKPRSHERAVWGSVLRGVLGHTSSSVLIAI